MKLLDPAASAMSTYMLSTNNAATESNVAGSLRIDFMSTVGKDKTVEKHFAWQPSTSSAPSLNASLSTTNTITNTCTSASKQQESSSSFNSKVEHDYHDYAQMTYDEYKAGHPFLKKPRDQRYQLPFPKLVHAMLDAVERLGQEHIVSWCPHGRAFQIHDRQAFEEEVLPYQNFTQSKYTSFQRQLNLYGFKRLTSGADEGAYYHELFLRGRIDLTDAMHRIRLKGTGHKKGGANVGGEPNLYAYPPLLRQLSLSKSLLIPATSKAIVKGVNDPTAATPPTLAPSVGNMNTEDLASISLLPGPRVSESSAEIEEEAGRSSASNSALLIMEQALAITSTSTSEQNHCSKSPAMPTYTESVGITSAGPRHSMYESDDDHDEHAKFATESFSDFAW